MHPTSSKGSQMPNAVQKNSNHLSTAPAQRQQPASALHVLEKR